MKKERSTKCIIPTEKQNADTKNLDRLTPLQIAHKINAEDFNAAKAVQAAANDIEKAMVQASEVFLSGHKIVFVGAGTSGRLGVLEAAECVPTFGTECEQIVGLIAGGQKAVFHSQEGAEDKPKQGAKEITKASKRGDFVIGLTASGLTPYVLGALKKAKKLGAHTALLSCNDKADWTDADIRIFLPTGPEALCGSTRMKAGTATKMALNAITTGAMALCGKMYGNLMVDVLPTNKKLIARAKRLISTISGADDKSASVLLRASGKNVKTAVVMRKLHLSKKEAQKKLETYHGFLHKVIDGK